MKALFVINGLGTGGAERSLSEMMPLWRERGLEPTVVCLDRRGEGVQDRVIGDGIPVSFLGGWTPASVWALRAAIRESGPQLVHSTIFEADVSARLAATGTRVPVVTSLVNTSYEPVRLEDPNIRRRRLMAAKALDGVTARHLTTHFHAITHAVKDSAVRHLRLDPEEITVIERGRDAARLGMPSEERRAEARAALGIEPEAIVIVTAGRQEYQKGQWHLVEAMGRLLDRYPGMRLLVAGRGGNASERVGRAIASAGVGGSVIMLGHRDDLPEVLAAGDVFVLPSLYEGLGGVLIEAMALGLPIVSSDIPAVREVVEPGANADLVASGSADALAGAIGQLLDDVSRRRDYSRRSRQIFEERFTLDRSADRMFDLFERVASEGVRSTPSIP